MNYLITTLLALVSLAAGTPETATIPEPDFILYGQVCLTAGPATDQSEVWVIARTLVNAQMREIGRYKMGDQPTASDCNGQADCYVLRVRVETVPLGATPSGTAVVLNQVMPNTVDVFIQEGVAPEVLATQISIDDRGVIRKMDLRGGPVTADIDGNGMNNLADYALLEASLTGPAIGPSQVCDPADINRDGRIDLRDYAILQVDIN